MLLTCPCAFRTSAVFLASVLLAAAPARAEEKRPLRIDDLFALREVGDPRLSPDGAQVAFTVRSLDPKKDKSDTDVYMVPVGGGDALRLTASPKAESRPRWSPDGKYLAFLSGREGKKTEVFLLPRAGGEAEKLTDFKGGVSDLAWSPDGARLALVVSDPDPDETLNPKTGGDEDDEDAAKKTPRPIVLKRLQFKRDVLGFLRDLREHVYVFDVKAKTGFPVTEGPYDDTGPVWSPDGQSIAFVSNRTTDPDANRNTDVFLVAPRPHAIPRQLTTAPTEASDIAFSPDGKLIAYVEGGDPADMYYAVYHLSVVPVAGGESRPLTKHLDQNPGSFTTEPRFSADGKLVYFLLEDRGNVHLARIPVAGGAVERLVTGERVLSAFELGPKGELVVLESQTDHPEEISLVTPSGLKRLSHVNDEVLRGLKLGPVSRHVAKGEDGTEVDYFLTRPPDAPAGQKLPAILRIHGGPVSQFQNEFDFEWQFLAANGYLVIGANPRGSSGRGRDFARAIWADWGGKDFQDVMAAVDAAVAQGAADPDRLGVGGWSYGGILTDWTIYQTNRFKAAIAGAGIANALAGYGTDHYQYEYEAELGLPWKTTSAWLKLSKPFLEADKIKTPTLFLCGEVDWNVPLINSEQMYQALRRLGVPSELVVYPGESHGIRVPTYQKDRLERYVAWYDRFLKPAAAAPSAAVEATSFLGQPLVSPAVPDEQRATLEGNLAKANADYVKDPDRVDNLIWVGRRLGYLGRYREAIAIFSRGIARFPDDVRLLRYRGHRYITVREPDRAIADLAKADELIRSRGEKDAPEPDGVAGPPGATPSTLFFNVYYHLGLAHYLKGDYASAEKAYRECLKHSQTSPDSVAATSRWLYATLRHAGKSIEAAKLVAPLAKDMKVGESSAYKDLLLLYKGEKTAEQVLTGATDGLNHPTLGYGVADFYLVAGQKEKAMALMREVVRGPQWAAFGFAAAEAELARNKAP